MHRIVSLFVAILFSTWILAQPADSTYSTPGSYVYTIPTGYTATLQIDVWGGGGSGGRQTGGGKGGGGGSAFASSTIVLGAGTYNLMVGAGGIAGEDGQSSDFNSMVVAVGGKTTKDEIGGLGGAATDCVGQIKYSGGHGGNGIQDGGGGGGGEAAGPEGDGANGSNQMTGFGGDGGAGATSGGDGGNGGYRIDFAIAEDGYAPGGGGGGKHGPHQANYVGVGGDGMIVVTVIDYALPISLLSFEGYAQSHSIQLKWSTATEVNNDFMAIERSVDGLHFDEIGRVNGQGTTYEAHQYQYLDAKPISGLNYYRLRQVDIDGVPTYHKIISIQMNDVAQPGTVVVYPNPVQDRLHLQWQASNAPSDIKVFDLNGKELLRNRMPEGSTEYQLSVSNLPAGIYVLQAIRASSTEVTRFQKL